MRSWKASLLAFLLVVSLDQLLKLYILRYAHADHYLLNSGLMFGVLKTADPLFRIVFLSAAYGLLILLSAFILHLYRDLLLLRWGVIIWLSGISGNIIDRVWIGKVVDFITFNGVHYFNLADMAQIVGFALVITSLFYYERTLFYPKNLRRFFSGSSREHRQFVLKVIFSGLVMTLTLAIFSYAYLSHLFHAVALRELLVFTSLFVCSGVFFTLVLGFLSFKFSQQLFGPLHAFERHVQSILSGSNEQNLRLRVGDYHPQLIKIAKDIQEYIDEKNK